MSTFWRVVMVAILAGMTGASLGCGDDGGGVMGATDAAPPTIDARSIADDFDHFEFAIAPVVPLQDKLFEVEVTAYSSTDDSARLTDYDGLVTLTSSVGTLSPGAVSQAITNGRLTFEVSLDANAPNVVLTATDDDLPAITGNSEPFYLSPPGSTATALQVVINEVNWFGNDLASTDEWIEIRNVSGGEINLSEWTVEAAGTTASPIVQFDNGTSLADGDYLVLARRQGADVDGDRSSLTGVANVQIHTMELGNLGEALILRDVAGTTIDQTPSGNWPAGDNINDLSMERRDEVSGGGYSDGAQAGAWYSWSSLDTVQTSNAATSDQGTPGVTNSDPDVFDHFTFVIQPASPKANFDFTVGITAYSSSDESVVATTYNGSVDLTTSAGGLSGEVSAQSLVAGVATLTVRSDLLGTGRTITAQDTIYPGITGTSDPFEVLPEGDPSSLRQVVISEVNYFGNSADDDDEWIEVRNISGAPINLSGWTIDSASTGAGATTFPSGSILADGAYLVLADQQGPDIDLQRTSLTGVADVQIVPMSLLNSGEPLVLRDVASTLIDETPDPGWPAGSNVVDYSMERRDEITGGGYTDGALDGAWYTWSSIDGTSTTSVDTTDFGTPGANNSNPDLFDHFTISVVPTSPIVAQDFVMTVRAFSSVDDTVALAGYTSTISVSEAVSGATLSGEVSAQAITAGVSTLTMQFDTLAPLLTLTVTDDVYPNITGTLDLSIVDTGVNANALDVVISEVNWFGSDVVVNGSADEWVEIRNVTAAPLDISGWSIDGLGASAAALSIDSNTILGAGAYLVIGDRQGPDTVGERTSLTGVTDVQISTAVALTNTGDPLTLRDIDGTLIDQTPAGVWPAGNSSTRRSMERLDNVTGGGYTDGSVAGAWYTWNVLDGTDTTSVDTADQGTPGANNTNPAVAIALPYSTGFEIGEPPFENLGPGGFSNTPPAGTPPTGTVPTGGVLIATTDTLSTALTGRLLQSSHCLTLNDDTSTVNASAEAVASTDNGGNVLRGRIKLIWYDNDTCSDPDLGTDTPATSTALTQGTYTTFNFSVAPPTGATHLKVRFEIADNNAPSNDGDDYAIDDISVTQP
jgi:hypothetical protein